MTHNAFINVQKVFRHIMVNDVKTRQEYLCARYHLSLKCTQMHWGQGERDD